MIAFGIRYLSGYAAAMDLPLQRPEWPVHPGRVFLAMVAAHYETGTEPQERAALQWLESQPVPSLYAAGGCERSIYKTFVPVNDGLNAALERSRQERSFPKTWLENDTTYLLWPSDPPEAVRKALDILCRKVTRIGHSTSMVQMWLEKSRVPACNWIPDDAAKVRLRVAEPGTLANCDLAFNAAGFQRFDELTAQLESAKGKQKQSLKAQWHMEFPSGKPEYRRPTLSRWQGYAQRTAPEESNPALTGPFDPDIFILTKREGANLGLEATLALTGALRNAVLKAVAPDGEAPDWVSGHAPDGSPTKNTHLALFPLPFVGRRHADGHIMGLGIAMPQASPAVQHAALGPFLFDSKTGEERQIHIWTPYWDWCLRRESSISPSETLKVDAWVKPSYKWASVTPVVLHHHPKKNRPGDVERILREAFSSALLPEPEEVTISSASHFEGAGDIRTLPNFDAGGAHLSTYQTHVIARFAAPVKGPVLVGRGRFRGYGLFRPVLG
ncbi:MAG: CRISPR-associated protein [Candidatus Sulfotelmatobacter sp.]|nr:CRISPR-associated protein [Candidatus Sulfotelmatobacter sp.]